MSSVFNQKWNVKVLKNFNPGRNLSILLFGCSASGKSSLINNLNSQNREKVKKIAKVRKKKQIDQCTISFKKYFFNERVWVFDTWGLCKDSNYSRNEFSDMLDGKVSEGTSAANYTPSESDERRIVDVVIFVFGPGDLGQKEVEMMKPFYEEAKRKKRKCLAVATMTDLWFAEKRDLVLLTMDPQQARDRILNDRKWKDEVKDVIIDGLMGDEDDECIEVLPVINYESRDTETNKVVMYLAERLALSVTSNEGEIAVEPPGCFEIDLFEGETPLKLRYLKEMQGQMTVERFGGDLKRMMSGQLYTEMEEDEDEEEEESEEKKLQSWVVSQLYFRMLQLGTKSFRFFVASMLHAPRKQILGLFHREGETVHFFETTSTDRALEEKLQNSFSKKFIGGYEFVNESNTMATRTSSKSELEKGTTHIHLALHGGLVQLLFKRKEFTPYCGTVEQCVQLVKKNTLLKEKVEEKLKELEEMKEETANLLDRHNSECDAKIEEVKLEMSQKHAQLVQAINGELSQLTTRVSTQLTEMYTKSEIDSKFVEKSQTTTLSTQLQDVSTRLNGVDTSLLDVYKKSEVDTMVAQLRARGQGPKVSSGTFSSINGNHYAVFNFNVRNDCNLRVTNTRRVVPPQGTYLVFFRGCYYAGCGYGSIYKNGSVVGYGYQCGNGKCVRSGTMFKTMAMNGTDYWEFYVSATHATSYRSNLYFDLEVIKLD